MDACPRMLARCMAGQDPAAARTDSPADAPVRGVAAIARAEPDRAAVVFEGRRVPYGEFDRLANAWAHVLAPHVQQPGDRVAVALPNGVDVLAAWHGVARLGALVVPVNTRLTAAEAAYLITDSGARALVHDAEPAAVGALEQTGVPGVTVEDAAAVP